MESSGDVKDLHDDEATRYEEAYRHYANLLRTWLVAYGVGASVLFLTNDALWQQLLASGRVRPIGTLFLAGVALQVFVATLNKTLMWTSFYARITPGFRYNRRHRLVRKLRRQYWIDLTADIGAIVLFAWSTTLVFAEVTRAPVNARRRMEPAGEPC